MLVSTLAGGSRDAKGSAGWVSGALPWSLELNSGHNMELWETTQGQGEAGSCRSHIKSRWGLHEKHRDYAVWPWS